MSTTTTTTASYWCYRCLRIISSLSSSQFNDDTSCPYCESGFVEEIETEISPINTQQSDTNLSRQFSSLLNTTTTGQRRNVRRRNRHDQAPSFNPIIVLRGGDGGGRINEEEEEENSSFELYYDEGPELGLRPIPETILEYLIGSGFHLLLRQLAQIDLTWLGQSENLPASKAAIESMASIEISSTHINTDCHCAVCKEAFEVGDSAREMPCKHIYHPDCILPWLAMRNSCPVCRQELPNDQEENDQNSEETMTGLSIWRLPGGGFAVGRYNGRRRAAATSGERGLSMVFSGEIRVSPGQVSWVGVGRRRTGGFSRVFRGLGSFLRRRFRCSSDSNGGGYESESNRGFVLE